MWPVVPFLLVLAVTLEWFPRRWITGVVAAVAVVYAGVVSVAVMSASPNSLIRTESGPVVTVVGVVILAAASLACAVLAHRPST